MIFRDRLQTGFLMFLVALPTGLALYEGLQAGMGRADFVFVNQGEVSSLDPALATGIPEGRILMAISEGLVSLHPETLEPLPACAASWEVLEEGRMIRFRLRDDLQWSDGRALTSRDFLYSWERLLDPETASPYAYLLWKVDGAKAITKGAEPASSRTMGTAGQASSTPAKGEAHASMPALGLAAPDPRTFEVRLESPCPYFLILTAFYPLFPVDGACIRRHGEGEWLKPENIVTNGPFRVEARYLKDRIRLRRNPHYWDREAVGVETVDALAVTSPITALNLYLTGEVDWINKVPPVVMPFVRDRADFTLTPNLGTNFLRFNTTRPPLDDPRVRRALHLAIDKDALVEHVLKGGQEPATSFVPPGIPGYAPPETTVYAPLKARELLAEAGFPDGEGFPQLNLLYSADETNRDLAEVMAMQLRRNLHIRIHPQAQERKGYFVSQNALEYHICFCSWLGDYLDASTFLDIFHSAGGNNRTGWADDRYDALLARAASMAAGEERAEILKEAEKILLREMPVSPLFFRTTANMIAPGWEGYHDNIQDVHPLKYLRRRTE